MTVLDQSIENRLCNSAHKEEETRKSSVPAGVFIEEPSVYGYITDPDKDSSESIE